MGHNTEKYTAILATTEVGLGSLIHAFHLPLGGHLLSLNQAVVLTFAVRASHQEASLISAKISHLTALLKSLSPMGKRLTPMLAISVQGMLFSIGPALLGANPIACAIGAVFSSAWAFIQPLLINYLIFGDPFLLGLEKTLESMLRWIRLPGLSLLAVLAGLAILKALVAMILVVLAWKNVPEAGYLRWLERWSAKSLKPRAEPRRSIFSAASRDLLNPWFFISFAMSLGYFWISTEGDWGKLFLWVCRALALGWLTFAGIRALPSLKAFRTMRDRYLNLSGHAPGGARPQC